MKTNWIALIPAYEPTELLCELLEQAAKPRKRGCTQNRLYVYSQ